MTAVKKTPIVTILMATYNGERFVAEQLDSLLTQTYRNIRIVISDDCSADKTWSILEKYAQRYPSIISIGQRACNSGSPWRNFMELMTGNDGDYLMLCDQDDVWNREKVERSLKKVMQLEALNGKTTPVLVHTDLCVTDERLNVTAASFKKTMNADYGKTTLNYVLIQNIVTGCTAIYNRALSEKIRSIPDYMIMHDWWLLLAASAFGVVDHLDEPTMLYRQHGGNDVGAQDTRTLAYKAKRLMNGGQIRQVLQNTVEQARAFRKEFGPELNRRNAALVEAYIQMGECRKLKAVRIAAKNRFWKNTLVRKLGQLLFM